MSLTLSLTPQGDLLAALPHEDGSALNVTLPRDSQKAIDALRRILSHQFKLPKLTGLPSAPTQWDIVREALASAPERSRTVTRQARVLAEHGGVVIRRLPTKSRKLAKEKITLESLGL